MYRYSLSTVYDLKATLGFSEYDDNENLINNVKEKLQDEFDDRVGELTLNDLHIAAHLDVPDDSIESWDELIARIEKVKNETLNIAPALSITETVEQIDTQPKSASVIIAT